jgi:hypothetical protein
MVSPNFRTIVPPGVVPQGLEQRLRVIVGMPGDEVQVELQGLVK